MVIGPVAQRGVCDQHAGRFASREDTGRQGAARSLCISAAGPLLARPYGELPVVMREGAPRTRGSLARQNFTFSENCQFRGSEAVLVTCPNAVLTGWVFGPEKFGWFHAL